LTAQPNPIAREALERIAALYAIEVRGRDMDSSARTELRQAEAQPLLDSLHDWLLAGLIKCEACSGAMTTATGKSGRYRYYKSSHKMSNSPSVCTTPNLPMERIDQLVLQRMVERVLSPERVTRMLREHMKYRQATVTEGQERLKQLSRALAAKDDGLNNLYRAIEQGIVALDSTLQVRVNTLKDEREAILVEMADIKHDQPSPRKVSQKQVAYALERMKAMLLAPDLGYGKQLLRYLVTDIRVEVGQLTLRGSVAGPEKAVAEIKMGTAVTVPTIINTWRARHDSNVRPLPSEGSTLSS
jgi:site-specific DNA recombinase